MLTSLQLRHYFDDLRDTALDLGHRRRPQSFLDQRPAALGPRPALSLHRPQRRDQYGPRQPQLDDRARDDARERRPSTARSSDLTPIITDDMSDSASFDEVVELLVQAGRSLPHAILMMIPEAWERSTFMSESRRDFYRYHAGLMEPWDGPASVTFCDGKIVGAVLDRNGLRPARYWVTKDQRVIFASEVGVLADRSVQHRTQGPTPARTGLPRRHRSRAASSTTRS